MVNYLKALIEDARTDILFIGYQAAGTTGAGHPELWSQRGLGSTGMRQRFDIKAGVHTISGYSAHADQHNLLNFIKRMRVRPEQVRIVHGDVRAKAELQRRCKELLPEAEVIIPTGE